MIIFSREVPLFCTGCNSVINEDYIYYRLNCIDIFQCQENNTHKKIIT